MFIPDPVDPIFWNLTILLPRVTFGMGPLSAKFLRCVVSTVVFLATCFCKQPARHFNMELFHAGVTYGIKKSSDFIVKQ